MTPTDASPADRTRSDVVSASPSTPASAIEPAPASACAASAVQLDALLGQVDDLLGRLEPAEYATPLEGIFGGSIGGHVRHCLDHVRVLVGALETPGAGQDGDRVDYDTRERGTDIESDPEAARTHLADLRLRLAANGTTPLDRPIDLSIMMSGDGLRVPMQSTAGREIAFVYSHTVHHQAMIGGMARHLGVTVPPAFGRAPSTIAHDASRACAR